MVAKYPIADLLSLTVPERLQVLEELWDSIAQFPDAVKLTDAQRSELDARLEEHRRDPSAASPWEVVKARLSSPKS